MAGHNMAHFMYLWLANECVVKTDAKPGKLPSVNPVKTMHIHFPVCVFVCQVQCLFSFYLSTGCSRNLSYL